MNYYIYILFSESSGRYYIGHSDDPWRRLEEHNSNDHTTYTSKHRPWILAGVFECGDDRGQAMVIERFIKKQRSKAFIEKLLEGQFFDGILAQLVRVPKLRD
ncbi:MAG: GIY-YIG nuclease family protein [Bacteroidales bacterium]|nr:GIY-YIG nuclease family protein [Bacteroidales bacterium]MDD3664857.1 GIY-YIG nuclease family protein [Bacteroidales bacterium]